MVKIKYKRIQQIFTLYDILGTRKIQRIAEKIPNPHNNAILVNRDTLCVNRKAVLFPIATEK